MHLIKGFADFRLVGTEAPIANAMKLKGHCSGVSLHKALKREVQQYYARSFSKERVAA